MDGVRGSAIVPAVLRWAASELRDLPWRSTRDPWKVLVAEAMLQQTQAGRVIDRWEYFVARFPDPAACAAAPPADIIRAWAGLGYNRRAVMLHDAASMIVIEHGGQVPGDLAALEALPGVGPYTARAVLAFAFEEPVAPVDTNIGRVLARLAGHSLTTREAQRYADALVPVAQPWEWNQGVMEIGAILCRARAPHCDQCPVRSACVWRGEGPDPAVGSGGVRRSQSRFDGSDRQLRGRLIDALRIGALRPDEIGPAMACDDVERRDRVVESLVADGLITRAESGIRLAGEGFSRAR